MEEQISDKWEGDSILDISFIIPVYNGETSIRKSIDSVRKWDKQPDIEILVIDDGSTDSTAKICQEIAREDARVKVYSIANCGQGLARNYGIKHSTGKYLFFADADDTVVVEEIYSMWEIAEKKKTDVVMGGYVRVSGNGEERVHLPGEGLMSRNGPESEQKLYHKVKTESAFGYVWNKLYRKEFLHENHLQMDDIKKVYMEDQLFNLKVWSKNPVWFCCDKEVYHYEIGTVSTTRRAEPDIHLKNITMIRALIAYLREKQKLEENMDVIIPLIMRTFCWSLVKNIDYEGKERKRIKERANAYIMSKDIQQMVRMRGSWKTLWKLPSLFQTVFYTFCLLLIRGRMAGFLSIMFLSVYPLMKKYISQALK